MKFFPERHRSSPQAVIDAMASWMKYGRANSTRQRTPEQKAWDSAILAASEYVRRMHGYDEQVALEIHRLLTPCADEKKK